MANTKKKPTAAKKKAKGKKNGRPSLLTDEVISKLADAISIGSSHELAALYAGISLPTLQNWLRIARAAKASEESGAPVDNSARIYLKFLTAIDEANGEAGIKWQTVVDRASRVDPQMALQMLRLRFSGYSERAPMQLTANIDLSRFNLNEAQLSYIIQNGLTDEQILRLNAGETPDNVIPGASPSAPAPEAADAGQPASGN
jgi:hypothetical protein